MSIVRSALLSYRPRHAATLLASQGSTSLVLNSQCCRPCHARCACCAASDRKESEFDEPDYALIDTLFSLAEAHLFMQVRAAHCVGSRGWWCVHACARARVRACMVL